MLLTSQKIADIVGISSRAVQKRGTQLQNYVEKIEITSKPQKLYKPEVLLVFKDRIKPEILRRYIKNTELLQLPEASIEESKTRVHAPHSPRSDRGQSRKVKPEDDMFIKERARAYYMSQGMVANVYDSVRMAVLEWANANGGFGTYGDAETATKYFYKNRIKRRDGDWRGWFFEEGWQNLWIAKWQKPTHNNLLANNRFDWIPVLMDANVIGEGFGFADFRAIDATKFDAWIKANSSAAMFDYYQVYCPITGFPIAVEPILHENTESLKQLVLSTYANFGAPRYAWFLDGSRVNRSPVTQNFLKLFFSQNELSELHDKPLFRRYFHGNNNVPPLFYNLANIPRFPFKAQLERSFRELKEGYAATHMARSYQGGNRNEAVKLTLNQTPLALKEAEPGAAVWESFKDWIYTVYVRTPRGGNLRSFSKLTGKPPTMEAAYEYFKNPIKKEIPKENQAQMFYYVADNKHRVKMRNYDTIEITSEGTHRAYILNIPHDLMGSQICVIPLPNDADRAMVYLENNPNRYDPRVPNAGDVAFLGEARDATVRSLDENDKLYLRKGIVQQTQKQINQEIKDTQKANWRTQGQYYGESIEPKAEIEKVDYEILDEAKQNLIGTTNTSAGTVSAEVADLLKSFNL